MIKTCNFCNHLLHQSIYKPYGSAIDLQILICEKCGLVQSDYNHNLYELSNNRNKKISLPFSHLDCDASYSDIRVGKQQMVHYIFDTLEKIKLRSPIKKVLDMKSARGHFAIKALDYFNLDSIDCIEEDEYIFQSYKDNPKINIFTDKYHKFSGNNYDLIYSCHTLEHYQDPAKYLNFIKNILKNDGYFYIDVPNIENIDTNNNIDQFFYDKHLYYYDAETLGDYIESIGFELLNKNISPQNISLLYRKNKDIIKEYTSNRYNKNISLIFNYIQNITNNRNHITNLNIIFDKNKTNVIFGCGRPLDAMIKYGNLKLDNFTILVDDFLSQITDSIYGKPLYNSEKLSNLHVDNMLLLIKNPHALLNKYQNIPNILTLSDILSNQ